MAFNSTLSRLARDQSFLRTGLCIGLAGGLAEIGVVGLHSALTGADAGVVARHVASSIGLIGASAATGVAVHMGLAALLGIALSGALQIVAGRRARDGVVFPFMLGSLAVVWAVNFFIVLPTVSPSFVHLLPYGVTLASKLAFGLAAAVTLHALERRALKRSALADGNSGFSPVHIARPLLFQSRVLDLALIQN